MTVLHALALSGTGKDESSDVYAQTEYIRGLEKLEISTQRLKKLLAKAAALHAERDGKQADLPQELIEFADAQEAKKLIEAAVALRKFTIAAKQPQISAYQAALAAARQEAASHMNRIVLLEQLTKLHADHRDQVADIRKHNDGLAYALVRMENEVVAVKEKREEAAASLAKARDAIAQAEQNLAKLEAGAKLELQNEIGATENEIAEQQATSRRRGT